MTNSQQITDDKNSMLDQNSASDIFNLEENKLPHPELEKSPLNPEKLKSMPQNVPNIEQNIQEETPNNFNLIQPIIDNIHQAIAQLQKDFEVKVKYDESKERTINALHKELQDYREDMVFKILRPLIMDITSIYDHLQLLTKKYGNLSESNSANSIASELTSFTEEIEEIVSRYGFKFYQNDSETYDRSKQKAQKIINTDDSTLDKQIVEHLRMGLQYQERIVRPETVSVYRYVSNQ